MYYYYHNFFYIDSQNCIHLKHFLRHQLEIAGTTITIVLYYYHEIAYVSNTVLSHQLEITGLSQN